MFPLSLASEWRREALRTNLWVVPTVEVIVAVVLYAVHPRARPGRLSRQHHAAVLDDQFGSADGRAGDPHRRWPPP
jgi:hypothetical protein